MDERMDARLRERLKQTQQRKEGVPEGGKPPFPLGPVLGGLVLLVAGGIALWGVLRVQQEPTVFLQVRTTPPMKDTLVFLQVRSLTAEEEAEVSDFAVDVYDPKQEAREEGRGRPTWQGVMGKPVELPPGVYRVAFLSNRTVPILHIPLTVSMAGQVVDTLVEICLVEMVPPSEAEVFLDRRPVECTRNPCPFPRNGTLKILRAGKTPYLVQVNGRTQRAVIDLRRCEGRMEVTFSRREAVEALSEDRPSGGRAGGSSGRTVRRRGARRLPSLDRVLQTGDVDGLARLLDVGKVRLTYRDQAGRTLLHLAASLGHSEMIRFLVHEGLDVNVRDRRGNTPLHYAAYYGRVTAIQTLLALGADLHARNTHRGETPLFSAIRGKKVRAVRYLIQRGARVNDRNAFGLTPLHVVACCAMGAVDLVDVLVAAGADLYARTARPFRNLPAQATALDVAEAFGNSLVAQALERRGVRRGAYGGRP